MKIIDYKLFHIDIDKDIKSEATISGAAGDLQTYTRDLIADVTTASNKQSFKFSNPKTTVQGLALEIINNGKWDKNSQFICDRLFEKEKSTQDKIKHLTKLKKGSLLLILTQDSKSDKSFIIVKIDHDQYLDEKNFTYTHGLPVKSDRLQKSCIVNMSNGKIKSIFASDTAKKISNFWWDSFLELQPLKSDRKNSKDAFNAISANVRSALLKKSKIDFTYLMNEIVSYFSNNDKFDINALKDRVNSYKPVDNSISSDITDLADSIAKLPKSKGFDGQFEIDNTEIKNKLRKNVVLDDNMELRLNSSVRDLNDKLKPAKDKGGRFIKIYSPKGYIELFGDIDPDDY